MAFHPYTQVIPQVFNPGGFGPPRGLTRASPCPCVDHSASGLQHATQRPIQTRFPYGYPSRVNLATHRNSQAHSSKGTLSPRKAPRLVSTRFQALFHDPSPECFSSFPHGTSSLSVTREYLGLASGLARFTRNSTGSVLLGNTPRSRAGFTYGTVTRYGQTFQTVPLPTRFVTSCRISSSGQAVPQPPSRNACWLSHATGLASSAFAHHYSRNRFCFLFLRVLRCFTSPRYHPLPYAFRQGRPPMTGPGFPIRKSSNHSPVAGSSRLIAGSNVLHRLLVPRHPPYALKNLTLHALHANCRPNP